MMVSLFENIIVKLTEENHYYWECSKSFLHYCIWIDGWLHTLLSLGLDLKYKESRCSYIYDFIMYRTSNCMLVDRFICVIVNLYYYFFSLEYSFVIYNMIIAYSFSLFFILLRLYAFVIWYILHYSNNSSN